MSSSYTFSHAIVRHPGDSILDGLRAIDTGAPDISIFRKHHADYVAALRATGATVIELPIAEEFPDSVFVEDSALCLPELAITMRPGAPSRFGEAALMRPTLESVYDNVVDLSGSGHVEGGDILTTESEVLVGLSARTDIEGVTALRDVLTQWGYSLRIVETPEDKPKPKPRRPRKPKPKPEAAAPETPEAQPPTDGPASDTSGPSEAAE